jgi:FkbH-like protein
MGPGCPRDPVVMTGVPVAALRLACIGCSNYAPLSRALRAAQAGEPEFEVVPAPYGQVFPSLLDSASPLWTPPPDVTLVWTQPQHVLPSFRAVLDGDDVPWPALESEVGALVAAVKSGAARTGRVTLVTSWALPADYRGRGCADWTSGGVGPTLARLNLALAEALGDQTQVLLLDAGRWLQAAGGQAVDPKLWLMGKIPYGQRVFDEAAADIRAAVAGVLGQARKLLVLDLDNTLWGGIVGDDGWEALQLGGTSAVGESFAEFQRAIRALQRRGVVLAICSKNDEGVALEAIDRHPEMLLRRGDFAAWRINWRDKAANLKDLVTELNLGLAAVVFIDDSPAERGRVREAWPEVLVPDWPTDPAQYARALRQLRCFDVPRVTAEDRERTRSYVAERQRREVQQAAESFEDWLARLELRVQATALNAADLPRATQLLNKTNQFNLTTRRLSEDELRTQAEQAGRRVYTYRVSDRFGDYGLTGLASLAMVDGVAQVTDFVLSCRVMGRQVEGAILAHLCGEARRAGCRELIAQHIPTAKNRPCANFLPASGFVVDADGWWRLTLPALPVAAGAIKLELVNV